MVSPNLLSEMKNGHPWDHDLDRQLAPAERRLLASMKTPPRVQAFLDSSPIVRIPSTAPAAGDGRSHGALLRCGRLCRCSAASCRVSPLILELLPNAHDDDHLLALFRRNGCWGAVAKSNFAGLRYREPVYRTLRELALSFFEQYYNLARRKTLRGYTLPLHLGSFDSDGWTVRDEPLWEIADRLDRQRRVVLATPRMAAGFSTVDERSYRAGLLGSVDAGLYRPRGKGAAR